MLATRAAVGACKGVGRKQGTIAVCSGSAGSGYPHASVPTWCTSGWSASDTVPSQPPPVASSARAGMSACRQDLDTCHEGQCVACNKKKQAPPRLEGDTCARDAKKKAAHFKRKWKAGPQITDHRRST
eukprot:755998-Pelagomonas_calceolata.AAC.7